MHLKKRDSYYKGLDPFWYLIGKTEKFEYRFLGFIYNIQE